MFGIHPAFTVLCYTHIYTHLHTKTAWKADLALILVRSF